MKVAIICGLLFGVILLAMDRCAHGSENQRRFCSVGTASSDSQDTTRFYDSRGRMVGSTATKQSGK